MLYDGRWIKSESTTTVPDYVDAHSFQVNHSVVFVGIFPVLCYLYGFILLLRLPVSLCGSWELIMLFVSLVLCFGYKVKGISLCRKSAC